LTDNQARDHLTKAQLALDKDGKFLAMRVATLANLGAYLGSFAPRNPDLVLRHLARRQLRDPRYLCGGQGCFH
jgi:carbon-monoxide dehydrogenase large subunit